MRSTICYLFIVGVGILFLWGCTGGQKKKASALLYVSQGALYELNPNEFIRKHPLADGENIRVDFLGEDGETSYHLAQIRDRESLHVHEKSDLTAILVRGHGVLRLGKKERKMKQGDSMIVPAKTVHAFINHAKSPAVAFVMFRPPFTKGDRVLVDEAP